VASWLEGLGLGQYATIFAEHAIDMSVLPDLTESDFEKIGVALGHRKRLLRALAARLGGSTMPAASAPPFIGTLPHSETERRQLTVLFCDLVGSTAFSATVDPEELIGIMRRFQGTCDAVITGHGGTVARFMGDGILAYFGYPKAHEDDAESAVRAGLDVVAKIGQLLLPSDEPLQVRVGIASGVVVLDTTIGEDLSEQQVAVGETPNLAARLQSLAAPNTVLVASSTRRLLGGVFVCDDLGPHEIKGIPQPILIHRILGERVVESRFDAIRDGKLTRFVGRQRELQELLGLWKRANDGKGQIALLCGEPGIGKSRISNVVEGSIAEDPHITIRYQCSPHHTNSPFYPVISQLERAARFERTDTPEVKLDKLEALLSKAGQTTLSDAGLFAALLSIPTSGRYPALDLAPQRQKDLTIDALIRQLFALARIQPVLFLIEDVHWIDPTTLELINRTIEPLKAASVLSLVTYRPEFLPPWLDQSHSTLLRLDRLAPEQAGAMVIDLTGGKELPAEVYEEILTKTDGVPLFVEELTKTVLESGMLQDGGDRYALVGPLPALAVPATLQDSLTARLDRRASIKLIPQIGATIGREFSYRLLAAVAPLSPAALLDALDQLAAAELIYHHGEPPDSTYIFKHALVQDAAYQSLLRSKRQELHGRIADVLKGQFPETVETQPELVGHHLAQAGRTEPAIDYLRTAGQRAIQRSANAEAIRHLQSALELLQLLPERPERKRMALGLQVLLGQAMIAGRGYAAAETREVLLRAKVLIDESTEPSQKFSVLYGIWACYYVGGEVAMQQTAAAEFLAEAERHGDSAAMCIANRTLGTTYVTMGEFAHGRRYLERALALYDPEKHPRFRFQYGQDIGVAALCYLTWALWHLGYVDQASELAAEAVQRAEELNHPMTLAYTICHARGIVDMCRRRPEEARFYSSQVISLCTEQGFPFWGAGGRILEGWAACLQGEVAGTEVFRAALAAWRKTGARLWLPIFLALEAEAYAKSGHGDTALQVIEEAVAISNETGERWAIAEVLRVKAALIGATGNAAIGDVEALLVKSLEIARRQQARCWELRTTCDLARIWHGQNRGHEALKLLRSIYDQFSEGFETADLQNAKALMARLESKVGSFR
jgi:class 3 adenylate cyclase/predicted ATPase